MNICLTSNSTIWNMTFCSLFLALTRRKVESKFCWKITQTFRVYFSICVFVEKTEEKKKEKKKKKTFFEKHCAEGFTLSSIRDGVNNNATNIFVCLSIYLSFYLYVYFFVHLSVILRNLSFICLLTTMRQTFLSFCLSVCLFICQSFYEIFLSSLCLSQLYVWLLSIFNFFNLSLWFAYVFAVCMFVCLSFFLFFCFLCLSFLNFLMCVLLSIFFVPVFVFLLNSWSHQCSRLFYLIFPVCLYIFPFCLSISVVTIL